MRSLCDSWCAHLSSPSSEPLFESVSTGRLLTIEGNPALRMGRSDRKDFEALGGIKTINVWLPPALSSPLSDLEVESLPDTEDIIKFWKWYKEK